MSIVYLLDKLVLSMIMRVTQVTEVIWILIVLSLDKSKKYKRFMGIYHLSTWMIKQEHDIRKFLLVNKWLIVDVNSGWLNIYDLLFRCLEIENVQVIVKIAVEATKHD